MKSKTTIPTSCRSAVPAITAALAAAGLIGSAQAAIQTAGALLVDVNATALPAGPLASIANAGSVGGVFEAGGSGASIEAVYGTGTKGIKMDGGGFLQHKDMVGGVLMPADPGLTGVNPSASIEAWVLNPSIPGEETIVAWGHRGGPDGSNMSFNYGYDARWGAIGHWGSPDIGWDSCCNTSGGSPPGVPAAGQWHHLVYTFDGTTQRIYVDGVLKNSENITLNTYPAPAITIGGQLTDDASSVEPALRASMTIGRLRIHDGALTAGNVANNYNEEKAEFTGVASFVNAAPIHRYRFANAAGGAPDESPITDSIGTAHGTVQGAGATFTGTRVTIPGGSSASEAYVDLPNNLLSVNSSDTGGSGQITFEGWTKVTGGRQWARILDFGSTDVADPGLIGGEVFGAGGGGEGLDYLFYDASENMNNNRRNVVIRNVDPLPVGPGGVGPEQGVAFDTPNFQIDFHWAITWDENGGVVRVYENGNEVGSYGVDTVANRFSKLNDVNVWLGRSAWSGDQNMQGEFDEFRIYNKVLTGEEVARNAVAGPAQLHLPGQSPAFDKQPVDVTVQEQLTATFSIETRGQSPMTFQWYKGANPIPGANGQSYSLQAFAADNGAQFKCRAENALGFLDSSVAVLNVLADTTPPTLVGAAGGAAWGLDDTHFGVRFSEPVNTADATTLANYSVSGITLVPGPLILMADNVTVVGFTTATPLSGPGCKSITVTGVIRDRSPSQNPLAVPATAGIVFAQGTMRYQRFNNSGAGFPNTADVITYVNRMENPEGGGDHGDNYRGQALAILAPPVTGAYTFYIASDDASELYLSTDENPANKVVISREPNWAEFRVWTGTIRGDGSDTGRGNPQSNISAPINLTAGCRYYLEFDFREGGGGDYCSVTWRLPGAPVPPNGSDPIPALYLSPFEQAPNIPSGQPADQTLDEGRRATLTANITGSPNLVIQWFRGADPIAGANGNTYVTDPLKFPDDNGAAFRVEAMNSLGTAVSRTAIITVNDDPTPPMLVRGLPGPALDRFSLVFNEIMDKNSAEDAFNYTVNGVNPSSAVLSPEGTVVTILFGPQTQNTDYAVTIDNVQDFAGNPIAHTEATIRSVIEACGGVQFQAYNAGAGNAVAILTSHPSFPDSPDFTAFIANLDSRLAYPTDAREAYGARMRGVFLPNESGPHFFYLAADDGGELWLSTDATPANKVRIATETSWSNTREWTASAGGSSVAAKKSPAINLIAGQAYYIEALYKEGGGGDHCSVAVQPPSAAGPPANGSGEITSANLGQFAPANIIGPVTLAPALPADVSADAGSIVNFDVTAASPAPFARLCYQWQRDSNDGNGFQSIAGANSASLAFGPTLVADNGSKFRCIVSAIGSIVSSREALLGVTVDTNPPTVQSILVLPSLTQIDVRYSEFVETTTSTDPFNYTIDGVNPPSVALLADGMTARITLAGPVTPASQICISIQNVTDLAGNVMNPNPTTRCIDTPTFSCGLLYFEAYNNIGGVAIDALLNDPRYPDSPDERRIFGSFDTVAELGTVDYRNDYGARVYGLFIPPTSGNWVFYLASDDASRLYLNPNGADAAGKQPIAEETGCCQNISAIRSAAIPLTGGARYYIEGVYKEGGGNDHIYVAARLEGEPAPNCVAFARCADALRGESIGIYADGNGVSLTITQEPQDQKVCRDPSAQNPPTATFTVAATALRGQAATSLQSENFNSGNGGCTVDNNGNPQGPWTYNGAGGNWFCNGEGDNGAPSYSTLTCPAATITRAGNASLAFSHRYSFEFDGTRWDGGQVRISVNGGPFTPVPAASFTQNGPGAPIQGNNILNGQAAYNGNSADYASGAHITSTADLGFFNVGNTIRIQFVAAWDEFATGTAPNWEIDSLALTEGAGGTALPLVIQWQRNNGGGYVNIPFAGSPSFTFTPTLADSGARFRALVSAPGAPCQVTYEALLTVVQINTPPRFDCGPEQVVQEDAGPQTVPGWVSGISPHSILRVPTAYANDFQAGPAGMTLAGTAPAVVQDGVLKLTPAANSIYGAASIAAPVQTYESLTVNWKSSLGGGGGGGADGYSVNIGEDVLADPGYGGEEGTGSGLIVAVDTFDNGAALDPCLTGIELKWRGSVLTCTNVPKDNTGDGRFLRKNQFVNASLTVDATGLATVNYDGIIVQAPLPNYTGVRASRVLFWARTGGANDNQWIDDFALQAFPFDASGVEASQTVSFQVSNNNPGLFSQQPAVSADGTLTYTPAPNACGVANVTIVAVDSGGTDPQCGGDDTSDPKTCIIRVGCVPDCPVIDRDRLKVSVPQDGTVSFVLPVTDPEGDPLQFAITSPPAHGVLVLNPTSGAGTYTPAPGYCGPDSFGFIVSDGSCSNVAVVPINVICRNQCPTAVAKASPNAELLPNQTSTIVISVNNSNACVTLDGSMSTDPDDDTLTYVWLADLDGNGVKEPIAAGAVATVCLELGEHEIMLVVDDGDPGCVGRPSTMTSLTVEVLSACEAVELLIDKVDNADLGRRNKRPLIATLKAACASFDRGNCVSAVNQLEAFQNKVRAQIGHDNPALADEIIALAQEILDAIDCEHGNNGSGNGEDPPPPGNPPPND